MLVLLIAAVSGAWAQRTSHWPDFNSHDYEQNPSPFVAGIMIDGVIIDADYENWNQLEVAAFVGDECRSAGESTNYLYNGYVEEYGDPFPVLDGMQIYYNGEGGETVTFKMYNHATGVEYTACTVTLEGETISILTGEDHDEGWYDPESPIFLNFTSPAVSNPTCTLTDGEGITALSAYTGKTVDLTYTRSFTEGKTSTVCLPFAYTKKEGDGSFYAFTDIEKVGNEYVATMTEPISTTLEANTPYLYVPNATGNVNFGGKYTIPATLTAGETVSGDWTFKGTFATIEWEDAQTGIYGFSAQDVNGIYQGDFVKVGEYVRIKPMRCYLQYGDGTSDWSGVRGKNRVAAKLPESIKVRLVGADGNVTAIGSLSTTTGEMTMDGAWYSINGTRLNGTPATKGIYVRNGKKVVIK